MDAPILAEGRTCWRHAPASRVAFLVDAEAYFAAVASAIARARRVIRVVGWDVHSRVRLVRGESAAPELPDELAARVNAVVKRRPRLQAYLLDWDFAMIYALEREILPLFRFRFQSHRRVHFRLDGRHPVGASHHQKIVVVDDALAFVGGLDLTAARWDTREHRADDPRRTDPGHARYPPFHDVQMAVDGEAARALAELVQGRWERATHKRSRPVAPAGDPWPPGLEPALRDVRVGIARTEPAYENRPEVREVERLYLEAVRAARCWLYFENQYLTSASVGDALAERLREPDGPEIVIVQPLRCTGWLENTTMGVLRARLVERLTQADRHGRLRLYHPSVPGLSEDEFVNVHSKVLVVDDRLVRIGSANLSNRSMGLDTECDLAVEGADERQRAAIAAFRDGLLAEHLGVARERVESALREHGSLVAAVEALRGGARTLVPLDASVPQWLDDLVPQRAVLDPERPVELDELAAEVLPAEVEEERRPLLWRLAAVLVPLALAAVAWRYTPLSEWIRPSQLASLAEPIRESPLAPLAAMGVFVLGGLTMVPVTALIVAAALLFGPFVGFATAIAGSMASAAVTYGAGRALWRDAVRRLAGDRLNRLSERLARRGVLSVMTVRIVPVAPFTVVNLVAGASHIRFRDYLAGTLLGMLPGTLAMTVLAEQLTRLVMSPGLGSFLALLAVVTVAILGLHWIRRSVERRAEEPPEDESPRDAL